MEKIDTDYKQRNWKILAKRFKPFNCAAPNHDFIGNEHGSKQRTIAVHVRYKYLYISLPSSIQQQREITKFCVLCRTRTSAANFSDFHLELNAGIAHLAWPSSEINKQVNINSFFYQLLSLVPPSSFLKLSNDGNDASEIKTMETKRLVTQRYLDQCFATWYQRIDLCLVCFVHVQIPEDERARVWLWRLGHNSDLAIVNLAWLSALQCWSCSC